MQMIIGKTRRGPVRMHSGEPDQMLPKIKMLYNMSLKVYFFQIIASYTKEIEALIC